MSCRCLARFCLFHSLLLMPAAIHLSAPCTGMAFASPDCFGSFLPETAFTPSDCWAALSFDLASAPAFAGFVVAGWAAQAGWTVSNALETATVCKNLFAA